MNLLKLCVRSAWDWCRLSHTRSVHAADTATPQGLILSSSVVMCRVRTILVLGYWVLVNIHRYWIVLLLGDIFCCSDNLTPNTIPIRQDSSQHRPQASERLFSSAFDWYSDRCNHLSGHHADMLLFIKHNHCHRRVLGFFVVIAMLYTSIGIGIGHWYR